MSSIISSDSASDYLLCFDEMPTEEQPSKEILSDGPEQEESEIPLEADDQPSTVLIYSIHSSPIPLPLPPLLLPMTAEQSVQSDEHELT